MGVNLRNGLLGVAFAVVVSILVTVSQRGGVIQFSATFAACTIMFFAGRASVRNPQ